MKIHKVYLKNYRQFRDVEIAFSKDSNKNFTIISGNNGTGKTTLLNALSWCLYGFEIHNYDESSFMSICNNKSLSLAPNESEIPVFVQIDFVKDDDIISIKRLMDFYKYNDNQIRAINNNFQLINRDGVNSEGYAEYFVERLCPKEILEYFLFDGARLSEYFKDNSNNIKNAIFEVSQLNLLYNLNANLSKVESKYVKEQKKLSSTLGIINEEILMLQSQKMMYKKSLEDSKRNLLKLSDMGSKIDIQLSNLGSKDMANYLRRHELINIEIGKVYKIIEDANKRRKNLILSSYPYILCYDYFNRFIELTENSIEKPVISSDFKEVLFQILESDKCICGVNLSDNNVRRESIMNLLNDDNHLEEISSELLSSARHMDTIILKKIKSFKDDILEIRGIIFKNENKLQELQKESMRINAILDNYDGFEDLINKKNKLDDLKEIQTRNIGKCETDLYYISDKLNYLMKKQKQEVNSTNHLDQYGKKIELIRKVRDASDKVKINVSEDIRYKIETLTRENFIKLQWKPDEFSDVRIDDNYEIFIKNSLGEEERPGDLSDGEKLCLGLCFTSALHKLLDFDFPLIIDAPLANLDESTRNNVAQFLPMFFDDKQVCLLVTDSEYTNEFRNNMLESIDKEYTIDWNNLNDGKESKVILND